MKTLIRIALTGGLLAGCGPMSLYYKPGVAVSRQQNDTTKCEVEVLREVPVNTQIRQGAPVFYPGSRYCNGNRCWRSSGYWTSGPVYSVDVNKPLRSKALDLCMAEKGYQPLSIPACSQSVKSQAPPGRTTTLPRLQENSCFIRNADDSYQIVTPMIASSQG